MGTIVHGKDPADRRKAYRCDVTYCTNKEVAFDYLRDRLVLQERPSRLRLSVERLYGEASRIPRLVMRGLQFAIVDEADSVLVDEARTPLIISSQAEGLYGESVYRRAMELAGSLIPRKHFGVSETERSVTLTPAGETRVAGSDWTAVSFNLNEKQKEELVRQGSFGLYLFKPDQHYLVKDGKVQIIDEYTGRLMADRSWEMGLHQLIEIKEGCEVTLCKQTLARISYQRFFRRYLGLAGMTGTAREVAGELSAVYRLPVLPIPTNRKVRRCYLPERIFARQDEKWQAVVETIARYHAQGRPVLVGTRSVEASEHLSHLLGGRDLPHRVLNARQDKEEAEIIAKGRRYRANHRGHQHGRSGYGYPAGAGGRRSGRASGGCHRATRGTPYRPPTFRPLRPPGGPRRLYRHGFLGGRTGSCALEPVGQMDRYPGSQNPHRTGGQMDRAACVSMGATICSAAARTHAPQFVEDG